MSVQRTWFDRVVGFFSPSAEFNRLRVRAARDVFTGHKSRSAYEGSTKGRRTSGWKTPAMSAAASTESGLSTLRERSRDLVRNNAWAAKGIDAIESNVVGYGIVARINGPTKRRTEEFRALWKSWAFTPLCDYDGMTNFYGLQGLLMRGIPESGEMLLRFRRPPSTDNLPVPLQLQLLEPDFLNVDIFNRAKSTNNRIIQGVEFDARGRRVGYHLYEENPSSVGIYSALKNSNLVSAADIIHTFRLLRQGQVRGVPWLAPVIIKLRDFDDYEDAQLLRQKIAACFTAFVHDVEAELGDTPAAREDLGDRIEPGLIEFLPPGKDVAFANPPGVDGYRDTQTLTLRAVAAGLGIPYEALTGDYSQVNFSSGRMGWLEFQRNIEKWRWQMLLPQVCDRVFQEFLKAATVVGYNSDGVTCEWTAPRREMIDPTKEVPAQIKAIRAGTTTLSEVIRESGGDPTEVLTEMAKDNKLIDDLKLTLDSDPRKTTGIGDAVIPGDVGPNGNGQA